MTPHNRFEALMVRETVCPACRRTLRVPEEALGESVQCPNCNEVFTAEAPPASAAPVPRSDEPPSSLNITARPRDTRTVAGAMDDRPDEFTPPEAKPPYRLHPPWHVALAAFLGLGSPFAGSLILAVNYAVRRQAVAACLAVLGGFVSEAALTWMLWDDQDLNRSLIVSFLAVAVMFLLATALQGRDYRDHVEQGGDRAPVIVAVGVGLLCFLVSLGVSIALSTFMPGQ